MRRRIIFAALSSIHIPYLVGVWPLERISHLSRRRRIMEPKKRICLILAALLSLSGVLPAAATDYEASDYLPLAVGNSWTYKHDYYDVTFTNEDWDRWSTYWDRGGQFTITVERTEVIDGKTYYVLSDMPANWPPSPPHFIAGKKLRWEGTHLMERTADGEQAIYRFDGTAEDDAPSTDPVLEGLDAYETEYDIPTEEGANRVEVAAILKPVPRYSFVFHGHDRGSRACHFLVNYGISHCGWGIFGEDHPLFCNDVRPLHAILGGTAVEYEDARIPTNTSSSSWGQVKQLFFAHSSEERSD